MHLAAVIALCALVGYFVWRDSVDLFIAWYSESDPPLTARSRALVLIRTAVALAAATIACATL